MKLTDNQMLSLCLHNDLGSTRTDIPSVSDSAKYKSLLLSEIESAGAYGPLGNEVIKDIETFVGIKCPCLNQLSHDFALWFRDAYQLISFQLKVKQQTVTEQQEADYVTKFQRIEEENRTLRIDPKSDLIRTARYLLRRQNQKLSLSQESLSLYSHHGPGAVYDRSRFDDKHRFKNDYRTLQSIIPADWFHSNIDHTLSEVYEREAQKLPIVCRLALVPKDWKGPRGVFISPKEAVFLQLGIDGAIKESINDSLMDYSYTPDSQYPSQELALWSSASRSLATLDLSDASDRITVQLIRHLYNRSDYIALAATRPSHCILPNRGIHKMSMLSPMGDGKTFPVLTQVCWSISMAAVLLNRGFVVQRPSISLINDCKTLIKVFGDDIICPTSDYHTVCNALECVGLRVNRLKSFYHGFFRESCGCDAFNGIVVTPVRHKIPLNQARVHSADDWIGIFSLTNRIAREHPTWCRTLAFLRNYIIDGLGSSVPWDSATRNPLALYHPDPDYCMHMNLRRPNCSFGISRLHRLEVNGLVLRSPDGLLGPYCDRYRYNIALFPYYTRNYGDYRNIKKPYSPNYSEWYSLNVLRRQHYRQDGPSLARSKVEIFDF